MLTVLLRSALVFLCCGALAFVKAQTPAQPGQLAADVRVAAPSPHDLASNASGAVSKTTIADPQDSHERWMNRLWLTSIVANVAGTSLDASTSWGKYEGNSILASSNHTFGARGVSIKAGLAAAVIIPQICLRRHTDLKGVFAVGNFAEAGIFAGTAVHNLHIRSAATVH